LKAEGKKRKKIPRRGGAALQGRDRKGGGHVRWYARYLEGKISQRGSGKKQYASKIIARKQKKRRK